MNICPFSKVHYYSFCLNLLHKLAFPISKTKLEPSSTRGNCFAVVVDTLKTTVLVPDKKLKNILDNWDSAHYKKS